MTIKNLLRKNIASLTPYSTARDECKAEVDIYLDANESPYPNGCNRYPDPHQKQLKRRLSQIKGLPAENIFIGNGSDEPIDLAYRMFCSPGVDNAVAIAPSYGMYKVAAAINDVELREVLLNDDFSLDAAKVLAATDKNTKLIFLCSPNNPSGNLLDRNEIIKIIEGFKGIVVLDEAYIDFAPGGSFLPELEKYPWLIVLQTLSKAWGMAGLRLGLAFASAEIVGVMGMVKYPYNINVLTQQKVLEMLEESPATEKQVAELVAERKTLHENLKKLPLIRKIYPSDANFVLVKVDDPKAVYDKLIDSGVIVRDRSKMPLCAGCLRITVGMPAENRRTVEVLAGL